MTLIVYYDHALWADRLQYETTFNPKTGKFKPDVTRPAFADKISVSTCGRFAYIRNGSTIPDKSRKDIEDILIKIIGHFRDKKDSPDLLIELRNTLHQPKLKKTSVPPHDTREEVTIEDDFFENGRMLVMTHDDIFEINLTYEETADIIHVEDFDTMWSITDTSSPYFRFGIDIGMTPDDIFDYLARTTDWIGGGYTCYGQVDLKPFANVSISVEKTTPKTRSKKK